MAVTIKDIARELSLSPAAVSLALNDSPMVSRETVLRVKETAQKMGYVRNQYARGLVRGKSGTIALVVPDIENVYFAALVKHVTSLAPAYDVTISITNESVESEWRALRKLVQQRVEAILLAPVNHPIADKAYLEWLSACPTPLVFTTARHIGVERPCVMCDLKSGMRDLTAHVAGVGAREIALLTGPSCVQTLDLREAGFFDALMAARRTGEVWRVNEVTYQNAYDCVRTAQNLPDALICVNDMMALGALNALSARGVPVPEKMRVAGFDDSVFSAVSSVPLTTVRQDVPRIARRSVEIALSLIDGKLVAGDELIPCALIPRRSTKIEEIH
jgi:LacI family transcriptional regulator